MSHVVDHVSEAQLHAYLDRDLEFADPKVRRAVGVHIADCSRCSALLKEVRQVYKTSNRLLDVSAPPERPAPSFEDIVQRAAELNGEHTQVSRFLRSQDAVASPHSDEHVHDDMNIGSSIDETVDEDVAGDEGPAFDLGSAEITAQDTTIAESENLAVGENLEPQDIPEGVNAESSVPDGIDQVTAAEIDNTDQTSAAEIDDADQASAPGLNDMDQAVPAELESADHKVEPETQPVFGEPIIPREEDIVFIESEPVVDQEIAPLPKTPPPSREAMRKPSPTRRGRGTRVLALAATIVVAVGIGGWFGRPYLTQRFGAFVPSTIAESESGEQNEPVAQAPSDEPGRQEAQEAVALNAPGETRVVATDASSASGKATERDRLDSESTLADQRNEGFAISVDSGAVAGLGLRRTRPADELGAVAERAAQAREAPASPAMESRGETVWSETSPEQAVVVLGGPLVAIDGSDIERVERAPGRSEIRVTQTTRSGEPLHLTIASPGSIGENPSLDYAEVTSREGDIPARGRATYGNYVIIVDAPVTSAELGSLLRRITVAPNVN